MDHPEIEQHQIVESYLAGRLSAEQAEYRDLCLDASVAHIVGGLDDVLAWLMREGYVRSGQLPHYHVRQESRS